MSDINEIKVILVGESGCGKTNLIRVTVGYTFEMSLEATLTSWYSQYSIEVNNKKYHCSLWDTNGHENVRQLNRLFIKDSKIVLIVFSMNYRREFEEVDYWYNYTKEILGEDGYIIALVGNKSDLYEDKNYISEAEIEEKAKELNIKYKITSALKDAEGFKIFLNELLEEYINKYYPEEHEDPKTIKIESGKKKNKGKNKCNN